MSFIELARDKRIYGMVTSTGRTRTALSSRSIVIAIGRSTVTATALAEIKHSRVYGYETNVIADGARYMRNTQRNDYTRFYVHATAKKEKNNEENTQERLNMYLRSTACH